MQNRFAKSDYWSFTIPLTLSVLKNFWKLNFWDSNNSKEQRIKLENQKGIVYLDVIWNLIEYSLKNVWIKAISTFTGFEIPVRWQVGLMTNLVSSREQNGYFSMKNQEYVQLYWNCLKIHCITSLGGFEWFLIFFFFGFV